MVLDLVQEHSHASFFAYDCWRKIDVHTVLEQSIGLLARDQRAITEIVARCIVSVTAGNVKTRWCELVRICTALRQRGSEIELF